MLLVDKATNRAINCAWLAAACLALALPAAAQRLPEGTPVRVQSKSLGGGWLDGKLRLNQSSGCTMVHLDRKAPGGYTLVALNSLVKLERQEKGAWVDVPLKPLLAKETKECREADND